MKVLAKSLLTPFWVPSVIPWWPWISLLIQIIQCQKLTKRVRHNRASESVICYSKHTTFGKSKVTALNWGTFCDMSKSVASYSFIKQRPLQTISNKAALLVLLLLLDLSHLSVPVIVSSSFFLYMHCILCTSIGRRLIRMWPQHKSIPFALHSNNSYAYSVKCVSCTHYLYCKLSLWNILWFVLSRPWW